MRCARNADLRAYCAQSALWRKKIAEPFKWQTFYRSILVGTGRQWKVRPLNSGQESSRARCSTSFWKASRFGLSLRRISDRASLARHPPPNRPHDLVKCPVKRAWAFVGVDLAGHVDEALELLRVIGRRLGLARHDIKVSRGEIVRHPFCLIAQSFICPDFGLHAPATINIGTQHSYISQMQGYPFQ